MRRDRRSIDATPTRELAQAYPLQLATRVETGRSRAVLRRVDPPAARRPVRQAALRAGTQSLHDARSRPAVRRRARAGAPDSRDRVGTASARSRTRATSATWRSRAQQRRSRDTPNSPYLQGAFIAMDPRTGAVRALVGGRDFDDSKFDRAVQARAAAGLDIQADRLRGRDSERPAAVVHPRRLAARDADMSDGIDVEAAELRRQVRGQDADAPRALPVAQRPDDPARHGARRCRA